MKREAPAAARNRTVIADVLAEELPATGTVLEVASGTGEHVIHFAERFPQLHWQPSDPDAEARASIAAWCAETGLANIAPPLAIDAASAAWPLDRCDAVVCINMDSHSCDDAKSTGYAACVCINMVHISEWAATIGLFQGCTRVLQAEASLILYGPYLEEEVPTAPSNLAFDRSLKERNPEWGLRDLAEMDRLADQYGFTRTRRVEMPANNLALVYRRHSS